jgi:tetratricopeptide (TPR) repeat protein
MTPIVDDLAVLRGKLETALADFQAGRIGESARAYRAILDDIPDQPDALHMLGAIAQRMGKTELALQLFDEALRAVPDFAQAWSNRGILLRVLKRTDEALQSGRRAIACDPRLADGWDITGLLLRERREYAAACEHHARAVALNPDNSCFQNNYAVALIAVGRIEDAYRAAYRSTMLDPSFAIAHLTLGNILNEAGYPDRAAKHYRKAATLDPSFAEAVASEGRALMVMGELAPGWAKMEVRDYDKKRFAALPRWQGEKIRHLLLYAEQGVGDVIHCLRYIPFIRDRVEILSLQVPASLQALVSAQIPDATIITPQDPLPAADAHGLLMSLPHFCGTVLDNIPASRRYIQAEESWRAPWRPRLAVLPKPHIGIVWMGNPLYSDDHKRSLTFGQVEPLLAAARPHFVSMQKGSTTATASRAGIFDADPWLDDFTATAGLIDELDLIITVDTGVAHLAGAMGRPVWTMLPFTPDWRWMLGRDDSPWYPTMRLFRQKMPRDWPPVIARIATALQSFVRGDRSVLAPPLWDGHVLRQNPGAIQLPDIKPSS